MIGILLVTHGRLAEELRAAALMIQPGLERSSPLPSNGAKPARTRGRRSAAGSSRPTRATAPSSSRHVRRHPDEPDPAVPAKDRIEIVTGVRPANGPEVRVAPEERPPGHRGRARRQGPGPASIYVASDLLAEEECRARAGRGRVAEKRSRDRAQSSRSATASACMPARRPKFVQTASRFKSEVKIRKNGEEVDGKSILGILPARGLPGHADHAGGHGRRREATRSRRSRT